MNKAPSPRTLRQDIFMPDRYRRVAGTGSFDADYLTGYIDRETSRPLTASQDYAEVAHEIAFAIHEDVEEVSRLSKVRLPNDLELLAARADLERNIKMVGAIARRSLTPEQQAIDDSRQKVASMKIVAVPDPSSRPKRSEPGSGRRSLETHKDNLIDEVIAIGGTRISTDMPPKYSEDGVDGFGESKNSRVRTGEALRHGDLFRFGRAESDFQTENQYAERGIYEAVLFRPVVQNIYEDVEPQKGKLFGRGRNTPPQRKIVGSRQVAVSEVVQGGSSKAAVELVYRTFNDRAFSEDTVYWSRDGRAGNYLAVGVTMPESLAEKVKKAAQSDPTIIRRIVERATIDATGMPEGSWGSGRDVEANRGRIVRPPYEGREKSNGGKSRMYFYQSGDIGIDPGRVIEFSP